MNLRKHVAGFALFSIIVGSAVLLNAYLNVAAIKARTVRMTESLRTQLPFEASPPLSFKVRQVSLDLVNHKSYTQLRLERQPGQAAPEKFWVTTVFFTPGHLGVVAVNKVAIDHRFSESDYVTTVSDSSFVARNAPRTEYFARVYVSTNPSDNSNFPDEVFDRDDLTDAAPVVIQWPNETRKPAVKFTY